MAIVFISANAQNNNVVGVNQFIPCYPDHNVFTTFADNSDVLVKDLMSNIYAHSFSEVKAGKPFINMFYDGTNVIGTLVNGVATEATLSVMGKAIQVPIVNGQFTSPITVHEAVKNQRISVSVIADGFPHTTIEVGGANTDIPVQIYQNTSGVYNVVPLKNIDLANYWQNSLVDMQWGQADLATITGLLAHTLFHYVLPSMNLTLTAEEQNGLNDIQTNVLPVLPSTLANVNPDNVNVDIHYNSYKYHIAQAKQAMDRYVADRVEIEKYTTFQ